VGRIANVVTVPLSGGTVYQIAVYSPPAGSDFTLSIGPTVANDNFTNAFVLAGLSNHVTGSNIGATLEQNEPPHPELGPACCGFSSVWWSWTAPSNGMARFSAPPGLFMDVYVGTNFASLSRVVDNVVYTGFYLTPYYLTNQIRFQATAGTTYQICIDGTPQQFSFDVQLFPRPVNDDFANRITLYGSNPAGQSDNFLAGSEPGEPAIGGRGQAQTNSVWWSWAAPASGPVSVIAEGTAFDGSSFDPTIAVFIGNTLSSLTTVTASADPKYIGHRRRVAFMAASGVTYQIAIGGGLKTNPFGSSVVPGVIRMSIQTPSFQTLNLQQTNNLDGTTSFNSMIQVGNAGFYRPQPLRLKLLARAGDSATQIPLHYTGTLPSDQVLSFSPLNNPATVAPGTTTNMPISGTCPAPGLLDAVDFGVGWGIFVLLEKQIGTNWIFQDGDLLFEGQWPNVQGYPGPGGGVIRLDPDFVGLSVDDPLASVAIVGPATVPEGSSANYSGRANYTLGDTYSFTQTSWTSSLPAITTNGVFTPGPVASNTVVLVTAPYTNDGFLFFASTNVTVLHVLPAFTRPLALGNGGLVLTVSNFPGRSNVIEATTNLSPATWVPMVTNITGTNWVIGYTNFSRTNLSRRFFRARVLQ
jgi:hypothetical protein